jgi:hypothetical protein
VIKFSRVVGHSLSKTYNAAHFDNILEFADDGKRIKNVAVISEGLGEEVCSVGEEQLCLVTLLCFRVANGWPHN